MTAQTPLPALAALADRFDSFGRFLRGIEDVVTGHPFAGVDREVVAAARFLVDRAGTRLRLSPDHLVAALAGATGGGKSSLFNALARMRLSPAGHLRPTTGEAHACVWNPEGADPLLDWLGVDRSLRFARESVLDAEDEAHLRGLVLLDLPDMDSVATGHRVEVDRLVGIVDLMIWVLDPQKYADSTVHEGYLRHLGAVREVTVVVFNQIDRLTPKDADRCLADLTGLIAADGLPGVPIVATSAVTGVGVDDVRALLEKAVAGRSASLARLEGELDQAIDRLAPMVGAQVGEERVTRDLVQRLADELAAAAEVDSAVADAGVSYARRTRLPGWTSRGWNPNDQSRGWRRAEGFLADPAAVSVAVRGLAAATSGDLPPPWQDAIQTAATAHLDEIPVELERVLTLALPRQSGGIGWQVARTLWWLSVGAVGIGVGWLGWHAVVGAGRLPMVAGLAVPVLLAGAGVVVGLLTLAVARVRSAVGARRTRAIAERQLREAAMTVAREVVAPVRTVLRTYSSARADLVDAQTR